MAAIIANPQIYPAPAPGQSRYGLFNAATVLNDLDARGIGSGFQIPAEDCGVVRSYDANCDTHPEKTFDEGLPYMAATPYWVYASRQCGSVGNSPAEIESSVRRRLASGEQREVEAQFWGGGAVAADPNLIGTAGVTTVVPADPGSSAAIAALEDSFYDAYGYTGVIHIAMRAYGNLAYGNLLVPSAGVLRTPMGSAWAIGAGYGIAGPGGAAPDAGNVWAFMTPPVIIRRSEAIVPDVTMTMDRSTNQYMGLAERVYAHTWVCGNVHAVQVPVMSPAVLSVGVI